MTAGHVTQFRGQADPASPFIVDVGTGKIDSVKIWTRSALTCSMHRQSPQKCSKEVTGASMCLRIYPAWMYMFRHGFFFQASQDPLVCTRPWNKPGSMSRREGLRMAHALLRICLYRCPNSWKRFLQDTARQV